MNNNKISTNDQKRLLLLINAISLSYALYKAFEFISDDLTYYYLRVFVVTFINYFLIGLSLRKYNEPSNSFIYLSIVFFIYAIFTLIGVFSETDDKILIDKNDLFMALVFTSIGFGIREIDKKVK